MRPLFEIFGEMKNVMDTYSKAKSKMTSLKFQEYERSFRANSKYLVGTAFDNVPKVYLKSQGEYIEFVAAVSNVTMARKTVKTQKRGFFGTKTVEKTVDCYKIDLNYLYNGSRYNSCIHTLDAAAANLDRGDQLRIDGMFNIEYIAGGPWPHFEVREKKACSVNWSKYSKISEKKGY